MIEARHGADDFVPARLTVDMFRLPAWRRSRHHAAHSRRIAHQGGRSRLLQRRRQHGARLMQLLRKTENRRPGLVAAELEVPAPRTFQHR